MPLYISTDLAGSSRGDVRWHRENSLASPSWCEQERGPSTPQAASLRESARCAQDDRRWDDLIVTAEFLLFRFPTMDSLPD